VSNGDSQPGSITEYFRRSVDCQPDAELLCRRGLLEAHYYRAGQAQRQTLYSRQRITVQDVFEYLAGGMTADQILQDFPELTREDINACFAFAADRERKLFVAPA